MIKLIDYDASQATLIRDFQSLKYKFKKLSLNLWFLQECKRKQVLPNFTRIRTHHNPSSSAAVAIHKARDFWLQEETRRTFRKRNEISKEIYFTYNKITRFLHHVQIENLYAQTFDMCSKLGNRLHKQLKKKLNRLIAEKIHLTNQQINFESDFNFFPNLLNLSNTNFTIQETDLLKKGLNFSFNICTKNSIKPLIAHTDSILNYVSQNHNTNLDYNKFTKIFKQCNFNVSGMKHRILISIKNKIKNDNLIITKADKGNCLVIQDRFTYLEKATNFLQNHSFTNIQKDPTTIFHQKLKSQLKQVPKNFFEHFNASPQLFTISNPLSPRLYCLPKIHKQEIPYRPIVASINSPAHKLSTFLSKQLPIILNFQPKYSVKNSIDFCKEIKDTPITNSSILFSFDVVNLFNNIPTSDCLDILRNSLSITNTSDSIAVNIFNLTQLALDQNFFKFNSKFYKQTSGLAMGSPLSPFLAELFMDFIEKTISNSPFFNQVIVWKRFVDDIFGIFNGTPQQLKDFHCYINTIHPNINFTLETENNNSITFLDLKITKSNNQLEFSIYRKPTTTTQVIPFDSSSPMTHKLAAFRSFFNRLVNIPLNTTAYKKELNTIFFIAETNKFPFDTINGLYQKILKYHTTSNSTSLSSYSNNNIKYFSLPYISKISEKIAHHLKTQFPQLSISFSTSNSKLKSFICEAKDKVDPLRSHGIYRLTCPCGKFYIGRTIRNFETRCKEHISQARNHIKRGSHISSAFSNHLVDSGHINLISNDFKPQILHKGGSLNFLNSLECLLILYNKKHNRDNILNNITEFTDNCFIPHLINL